MKRSEAQIEQTWDIANVYESLELYESELERFKSLVDEFSEKYDGKIDGLEMLEKSLQVGLKPILFKEFDFFVIVVLGTFPY